MFRSDSDGAPVAVRGEDAAFELPDGFFASAADAAQRHAALETALRAVKARGGETLYLYCARDDAPFFESCGFVRCSVLQTKNGVERIRMAKNLALEGLDWLGFDGAGEALLFRCDFDFPAGIERVTADILTHGFFEAYLNGQRISDDLYAPAWTNYNEQDYTVLHMPNFDTYCYRSHSMRYDLTAAAKEGKNAFAVHIGDGWYGQWECENEGILPYGEKKLCFRITVQCTDGAAHVFSSNDGGVFRPSFITRTSMYFGESQDLRGYTPDFFTCALNDPACKPVKKLERPYTLVQRQTCPPDRVLRRITDPAVLFAFGDCKIYDLGENVAGFAVLRFSQGAERGERVRVRYAENLNDDGSLNFHSTGGAHRLSVDDFCLGNDRDLLLWPRFLWHAGRYVEVTGNADFVCFCVAASDVPVTAEFRSSDKLLNWLFDAYTRTQTANIHTCVPSDCPHRERLGYTGDGQLTAAAVMTVYDARALYRKWMRDIADCQDIETGHVPHTAPFYGGGGGPGGWGCAIVEVPYRYWKFYGDDGVPAAYYPHMKKYLDYLASRCDGHIVMREEPDGWCLGDWCTPHSAERGIPIPPPFVNTFFYLRSLRQVMELAPLAGAEDDLPELRKTAQAVAEAFLERFFDETTGSFCGGVCGADAFALELGLGDERTLRNLVDRYRESGTFDTGIFGTPLVLKVLFERGFGNDAFRLLTNRGEVSFRRMMESGATTLWEEWFNENSSSHPMFGAVTEYLFKYLLGIRQPEGEAGFRTVSIEPCAVTELAWAEGSVLLGGKRIRVRVERGRVVRQEIVNER